MKLGYFTPPHAFAGVPLEATLVDLRQKYTPAVLGAVELGTGNYPGSQHLNPDTYLRSKSKRSELLGLMASNEFEISALSCHGNPVHPQKKIADEHSKTQRNSIILAGKLGIGVVVGFSGLSGDGYSRTPIWVTNPWPDEQADLYKKQLEVQVKYWNKMTKVADDSGIDIAIELHPNMFMHNPATFKEVKQGVKQLQSGGKAYDRLKTNPDLSHFVWRGMDPVAVIRELKGDIAYMHAKDALTNRLEVERNGNIDSRPFSTDPTKRAWSFVYVGSGDINWVKVVRELRRGGYDGVLSIEHEDGERDSAESLEMAINHLTPMLPRKMPGPMTWAKR